MAGRKADPLTPYRVRLHKDKGYRYASTQQYFEDPESGRKSHRYINWGTVTEEYVFNPNNTYRLAPISERMKLIFPDNWDISRANALNESPVPLQEEDGKEIPVSDSPAEEKYNEDSMHGEDISGTRIVPAGLPIDQYNNRLYGSFWLLEQVARQKLVFKDLMNVFQDPIIVNEIIALAIYPYLSRRSYNRMAAWQRSHKTTVDGELHPSYITKLTQRITDDHRMRFIKLRVSRQPKGAFAACDSTTRSAWGRCLADIRWGHNKDNNKLQNTVEVVVYSLETHEPVYYRSFPGNVMDMSTVRTIVADMNAVGVDDIVVITDRGYTSMDNMLRFIGAGIPFIMCSKISQLPVSTKLLEICYDKNGMPLDMEYDPQTGLCCRQFVEKKFTSSINGTDVIVDGLKVNVFLDIRKRAAELLSLKLKLDSEKADLEAFIQKADPKTDIKAANLLYEYHKLYRNENGAIVFARNEDKVRKEESRCGYFSSVSFKTDLDAIGALRAYRLRDEQEKYFEHMKDQMGFHTQQNSSETGKAGRLFILFVGLILTSHVRNVWWSTDMKDIYNSSLDMVDELEPIRFSEYTDGTVHMTSFTAKQVQICDAFGIEPPLDCLPVSIRNIVERKKAGRRPGRPRKATT